MRHFPASFMWIFLLLGSTALPAQNAMFIPFGLTKGEVKAHLESRMYQMPLEVEEKADRLLARTPIQVTEYFFDDGILYAINSIRRYQDKKEASLIYESCMDYLNMVSKRLSTMASRGGNSHYAVLADDRIVEVIYEQVKHEGESVIELRLKTTSRQHGPRLQVASYAAEIAQNY